MEEEEGGYQVCFWPLLEYLGRLLVSSIYNREAYTARLTTVNEELDTNYLYTLDDMLNQFDINVINTRESASLHFQRKLLENLYTKTKSVYLT